MSPVFAPNGLMRRINFLSSSSVVSTRSRARYNSAENIENLSGRREYCKIQIISESVFHELIRFFHNSGS